MYSTIFSQKVLSQMIFIKLRLQSKLMLPRILIRGSQHDKIKNCFLDHSDKQAINNKQCTVYTVLWLCFVVSFEIANSHYAAAIYSGLRFWRHNPDLDFFAHLAGSWSRSSRSCLTDVYLSQAWDVIFRNFSVLFSGSPVSCTVHTCNWFKNRIYSRCSWVAS